MALDPEPWASCELTDAQVTEIARGHSVSPAADRRLNPYDACFLYLYRQLINTGEWEPWYNPVAYIRFAELDAWLQVGPGEEPNWEGVSASIFLVLGAHLSRSQIAAIGEGNLDTLAGAMKWVEEGKLPDGTKISPRGYNAWRRTAPNGPNINGPARVFWVLESRKRKSETFPSLSPGSLRPGKGGSVPG